MAELPGYGFTYNPEPSQQPTRLFAWQICHVRVEENALEDADNYPDYLVNRSKVIQALGLGMAQGHNAFPLNDQLFAVAVSIQNANGEIEVINESYPGYGEVALVVAEQLLRGEDHGMVAQLPNGNFVPFMPPTEA